MRNRRLIPAAVLVILIPFLSGWEGMDLTARHQRIDPAGVITFCIGATNYDNPQVRVGQKFTVSQCDKYLVHDLPKYEAQLSRCIDPKTLPPHRHASFLDFVYNEGGGTFCRSSIVRLYKQGDIKGACHAMLMYSYANHRYLRGLHRRREAEYAYCMRDD